MPAISKPIPKGKVAVVTNRGNSEITIFKGTPPKFYKKIQPRAIVRISNDLGTVDTMVQVGYDFGDSIPIIEFEND